MHHALSQFTRLVPGFSEVRLSLDDLAIECDRRGIDLIEIPMRRLHGCSWTDEFGPCIYLNRLVPIQQRTIAGWHEFAHLQLHLTDSQVLMSAGSLRNRGKFEREAETIGVIAFLPLALIQGMSAETIAATFGLPKKTANFRLQVYERHRV